MLVPLRWFGNVNIKEEPLNDEEEKASVTAVLRKSYRQSVRRSQQQTDNFNRRQSMRALARTSKNNSIRSGRMGGIGGGMNMDNSVSMRSNRNNK